MALKSLNVYLVRCQPVRLYSWLPWSKTKKSTDRSDISDILDEKGDAAPAFDPALDAKRQEVERKRNKSRLNEHHRRVLTGMRPYDVAHEWYHNTIKYKRRILGRYGINALDVPAGVAWPTPDEVEDQKEFVRVSYPLSLQESWAKIKKDKEEKEARIRARDEEVAKKVEQVDQWIEKLHEKIEEKKRKEAEAIEEKERLIKEVRKQFNFFISIHDERFKQALELKIKETKQMKKEARRQVRLEGKMKKVMAEKEKSPNPVDTSEPDKPIN